MKRNPYLSLTRELKSLRKRLHKGYVIKSNFGNVANGGLVKQTNLTKTKVDQISKRISEINILLGKFIYLATKDVNGTRMITGPALKYELEETGNVVYLSKFTMKPTI